MASPKIFNLSFNKCGTSTLHGFFAENGLNSRHHGSNNPRKNLALNMYRNFMLRRDPLTNIGEFDAYSDLSYASDACLFEAGLLYPSLHEHYPEAYFIFVCRPIADWVDSRRRHGNGDYLRRSREFYQIGSDDEMFALWQDQYRAALREMTAYFAADTTRRFLVFDLYDGRPEEICRFLAADFTLDPAKWRARNVSSRGRSAS